MEDEDEHEEANQAESPNSGTVDRELPLRNNDHENLNRALRDDVFAKPDARRGVDEVQRELINGIFGTKHLQDLSQGFFGAERERKRLIEDTFGNDSLRELVDAQRKRQEAVEQLFYKGRHDPLKHFFDAQKQKRDLIDSVFGNAKRLQEFADAERAKHDLMLEFLRNKDDLESIRHAIRENEELFDKIRRQEGYAPKAKYRKNHAALSKGKLPKPLTINPSAIASDAVKLAASSAIAASPISAEEVLEIADDYQGLTYRNGSISADHIRAWLNQFQPAEQPLMLRLLRRFQFYSVVRMRESMKHAKERIGDWLRERNIEPGLDSVKISAFGTPAKSSSACCRFFVQELDLAATQAVTLEKLELNEEDLPTAIIFLEDVIGSGEDVSNLVAELDARCGARLRETQIPVIVVAIHALDEGLMFAREKWALSGFAGGVLALATSPKCFHPDAAIFENESERAEAERIAYAYGERVRPDKPLGYRDSQLVVGFHDNCPNNTLSIFWAKPDNASFKWRPLFPRKSY